MTSVAVISSAVARINCLKDLFSKQSLPKDTDEVLKSLEGIKEFLEPGDIDAKAKLEREIVRLSYDIVDAVADASSASKDIFSGKLSFLKKNGNQKLQELHKKLNDFRDELKKENPEGTGASPSTSEVQARPKHEPAVSTGAENQAGSKIYKENSLVSMLMKPLKKKKDEEVPPEAEHDSPVSEGKVGADVDMLPAIKGSLSVSNVVCVVGESGMGKSTLARKLFHDLQVEMHFEVCGWVPINQNFQIKRVLQVLLQKLGPRQQVDMTDMNETELIAKIFAVLKNKNYLLVLDDVPAVDDWESIRLALPIAGHTRIIITTSSKAFTGLPHSHEIRGMTQSNILTLLKKKANFRPGLEEAGKAIFDISAGSPLLATILGKTMQLDAATARQKQQFVNELHSYHQSMKGKPPVLGVSYKKLAPELKPYLLYLSLFPQGQDIEVEKLYLLLTAENLLLPAAKRSQISMQYLIDNFDELARRKLVEVQVDIMSTRGNNKSYGLHDQILEFCKDKGLKEEFLQIVELGSSAKVGIHTRRLAINLSKYNGGDNSIQFESHETLKKILSLMIFDSSESAEEKSDWPSEIDDFREFIHLRILNFDGVDFKVRNVPRGIDKLVLLRYLSFRGCQLEKLPSSLSNLTQLETLDLVVQPQFNVFIPQKVFSNMKRMMHLYFPMKYSTSNGKVQLQNLDRLEILVNFDTEVCDVKALSQFKRLKIFSTMSNGHTKDLHDIIEFINERADMLQHSSVDIRSLDYYSRDSISTLRKLLDCKFVHSINIEGQIGDIPGEENHAEKVADMVLDGSEFEKDPMNYLGMFQNLQSLVLRNDAFVGSEIVIAAAPLFRNLRSLKLQNLEYVEKITIEKGAMPKLSTLQIDSCDLLQELSIPKELDDRLKKEQGDNRDDAYSIMPFPPTFNVTHDQP